MFDPARDDDPGSRPFYRRLAILIGTGVSLAVVFGPVLRAVAA